MEKITNINTPKRIVYGEGSKDSKIMIIGEAPGAKENKVGKPFVGKAGQTLDKMLNKAGLMRTQCYVTNVIKEQPHSNDATKFIKFKKSGVETTPDYDKYEQYLYDEIRDVNPNVIIALGKVALWAVARQEGITKWRGSVFESEVLRPDTMTGYKVIPTIHPAATFHQYIWRHYVAFDLKRAKKHMSSPEIEKVERRYILGPTYHESIEFIHDCMKHNRVAFDIEVGYGKISCISFAYSENLAISIPFIRGGLEYFSPDQEAEIWRLIGSMLEDPNIEALGQNTTFDTTFLFRQYGIKSVNIQDTMIAQAINYPDFPKSLAFINSIYTDIPYYKDEGKEAFNKDVDTAHRGFWLYNAKDSIVLMSAFPKQLKDLERMGNKDIYEKQRKLIQPLLYMTERGINMDTAGLNRKHKEAEEELERLEQKLAEVVGYPINPRSPAQLKDYFYGNKSDGGLGITPYREKGRPTTNEGALIRLARGTQSRDPVPAANIVLDIRKLTTMNSRYYDINLDRDGRLRSSMNPVGTRFGRLSSSKTIFGTGGNMQNQPHEMKEYQLADENCVVYDIDLGQADNRVVAYIAPEQRMIEAFENDIDIHSRTASYIFNMPEDQIRHMNSEGVMCNDIGTGDHTHRFWGKKANHAFNYGQGYKKFAYQVEIPEAEGKMIHNKYHHAYPGIRRFHKWVQNELKQSRSLTNIFGRKCIFLDRWGTIFEQAYSFIPQSTVADIVNQWGINHVYYDQEKYHGVEILNQIHDSLVIQISLEHPLSYHAESIMSICNSMEQTLEFRGREFSIPCDLEIHPKNLLHGKEVGNVSKLTVDELEQIIKEEVYKDG